MSDNQSVTDLTAQDPGKRDLSDTSLADAATQINQDLKEEDTQKQAQTGGQYGYIDIARTPINPDLCQIVDANQAEQALLIPFYRLGTKLRIAVADPENELTKALIKQLVDVGYEIQINLATQEGILQAVQLFHQAQSKEKQVIQTKVDETQVEDYQHEIENLGSIADKIGISNAKEGLTQLQLGAIKTKASDIHFQPEKTAVLIRFRIDGMLQDVARIDRKVYEQLAQQIKYEAGMKLNVHDVPQDGRIGFEYNDRNIDVRVSVLPTAMGETLVLRILDSGKKFATFESLGFRPEYLKMLDEVSNLSQGMILVTGPTGSGKTTTLYTLLSKYNTPEKKIITLEDPVEYHLDNIVQSQIKEDKNYTFASGLESILRQDPDVVMIGEIRDLDTANTAIQAALTGHVMLSTLHTNSALESIPRLVNIGMSGVIIAPALDMLMAQRLVRTFCPHCVQNAPVSDSDRTLLEQEITNISAITNQQYAIPAELPAAQGCDKCNHTGFLGRNVIAEMLRVDDEFRDLILKGESISVLKQAATKRGMITMKQDGILKVLEGKTALTEVLRVTN
jgi:type II secretory ATPase GspE/PulE/Tfp pilus assembly ATPase PilB-like protein